MFFSEENDLNLILRFSAEILAEETTPIIALALLISAILLIVPYLMVLRLQMATRIVFLSVIMVREFLAIALLAILRNLIVTNNIARDLGGGMYSQNSLNQITNVDFVGYIALMI